MLRNHSKSLSSISERNNASKTMKEDDDMEDVVEKCIECEVRKANSDDQTTQVPTASKRCIECQMILCNRCLIEHRRHTCKLLEDRHIVDVPWQIEANAVESSQSNDEATAHYNAEQIPCYKNDSANVSFVCLPTTHAQNQTKGTYVMAQLIKERDRLKEYEAEMSRHIFQLLKREEDTNTMTDNITKMIHKKHSECLARLESDKNSILEQLDSVKEEILSENETNLEEAISYLQKITERRMNFEDILNKGSVEANDEFTKSLLLHIHFQRPLPSLGNVSFHESSSWTGTDTNILGRLEGLSNISKTQAEPTLASYKEFLRNVYSRTTDAKEIHWKVMILNEAEMKNLCDLKILQGVHEELYLSRDYKKWDELHVKHVLMASLLYEVTRPTFESSSEKLERHLTELHHITGKLWNTIQLHIHYRNSERGLIPEGFQNYGNTGYFNSVLQCLLQTIRLPFELTVNIYGLENVLAEKKEMYCLSKALMELASKYYECKQRKGAVKSLYYQFNEATQRFNDGRQHDSHVLLIYFLEKLRLEERSAWKIPSAGPETQKILTAVDRIFGGQFITVYTCHRCDEPYAIREPFLDISIPLCTLPIDEKKPEGNKSKPTAPSSNYMNVPKRSTSLMGQFTKWLNKSGTSDAQSQQIPGREVKNDAINQSTYEASHCPSSTVDGSSAAASKTSVIKTMLETLTTVESSGDSEVRTHQSRKVRDINNKTPSPRVSQCLKYFTRAEVIDSEYLCRTCQTPGSDELTMTSATKRTLISSPPAILVLHLKRFEQKSTGFVKRDEFIAYDELLDLGPFCSCSALRIDPEEENVWYSLYAVVVHRGFFLSQGHYFAYVKQRDSSEQLDDKLREKFLQKNFGERVNVPNDDDLATMEKRKAIKRRVKAKRPHPIPGQWFYISDDFVRPCDEKEALDQKAFLLFYERISGTCIRGTCV